MGNHNLLLQYSLLAAKGFVLKSSQRCVANCHAMSHECMYALPIVAKPYCGKQLALCCSMRWKTAKSKTRSILNVHRKDTDEKARFVCDTRDGEVPTVRLCHDEALTVRMRHFTVGTISPLCVRTWFVGWCYSALEVQTRQRASAVPVLVRRRKMVHSLQ